MAQFLVDLAEEVMTQWLVEADNEDEALKKAINGEGIVADQFITSPSYKGVFEV